MATTMQPKTSNPPLLQTIVRWNHIKGGEAHCLARLYRQGDTGSTSPCAKGIAVLSEIRSNDRHRSLILDLVGVANTLVPTFLNLDINPRSVTWLIQYGAFSNYELSQREEWGQVGLVWNGSQYELDWNQWKTLQPMEIEALSQMIDLAPVFDVLNLIGWTQR